VENQFGAFAEDGREFVITNPKTPRHWYNYFWNDDYVAFASQVGAGDGFAQDSMGRRALLVTGRRLFLVDSDTRKFWTANGLPLRQGYSNYRCTHGLGYSEIALEHSGIASSYRMFVPVAGTCEVWSVRLRNLRPTACTLKAIPYFRTALDGFDRPQDYFVATGGFDKAQQAVVCKNFIDFEGHHEVYGFLTGDQPVTGYDCRQSAFVGHFDEESTPEALIENDGCRNSDCVAEKLCFALQSTIPLQPDEERTLHFVAGTVTEPGQIGEYRQRFFVKGGVDREFVALKAQRLEQIEGVTIDTPDANLNCLFNYWIKHQTNLGSRWARVRHNGYRDLTGDCECLGSFNPTLAWTRFKRVLSYQYSSGYAPRTWLNGEILDRGYIDCTVWLTYAAHSLVKEIGQVKLLDEEVPFNDGTSASVYEHLRRSVEFLWNFRAENGLVKIGGGDWNDCMERVGRQGKGSSVWLSMAWYRANGMFAELAALAGHEKDAVVAQERAEVMRDVVDRVAWDGEYYTRAYTDAGKPIGSHVCDEGKIFANPQIWAVLSSIGKGDKVQRAIAALDKHLDTKLGLLISRPPYSYRRGDIGHVTMKPPGVHENGGVYLHPALWKLAADCLLHRNDKVQEGLEKILPFDDHWVCKLCEPYIMCNSYFGRETGYNYAAAGQSWRTGAGAWLVKALVNFVFGLKPEKAGLMIDPCLPPKWKTCSITKNFRRAVYSITFEQNSAGECEAVTQIEVDGKVHHSRVLPYEDNHVYRVKVILGKKAAGI
jgi:cellobiose phosphorylase